VVGELLYLFERRSHAAPVLTPNLK
jgi:hypothetical protein